MSTGRTHEVFRLHWWFVASSLFPWIILTIVFVISGKLATLFPVMDEFYREYHLTGAVIILTLMIFGFLIAYVQWLYTTLTLDSDYLIFATGIINRRVSKIPLQEIASIDLQQSIFQRILTTGNLVVDMRGASLLRMNGLDDPATIQNHIMDLRNPTRFTP